MMYSVYDPNKKQYEYYTVPREVSDFDLVDVKRRVPKGKHKIGLVPESLAERLPRDAQLMGVGPAAKGVVCTKELADVSLGDVTGEPKKSLALAAVVVGGMAAYFFYKSK